jgi:hypothetical protein
MNTIPVLLIMIVLLIVYIILFIHGRETPKNNQNTFDQKPIRNEKQVSVIGKTKTSFPSREAERKPEEADENRTEKPLTFAPESPSETDENEFNPIPPENETDVDEVEKEELDILFGEDIEVSGESLTTKEIRQIQQAVKRNTVSEQEKPDLLKTAEKLHGSDFLEKLKSHEALQSRLNAELMQLLSGNEKPATRTETSAKDWTSFL